MQLTRIWLIGVCVLALGACSSHPRKVDCEAHLVPINPPAHVSKISTEVHP